MSNTSQITAAYAPAQAGETTARDQAKALGVFWIVERAITFHPQIEAKVWGTRVRFEPLGRLAGQFSPGFGIKLHSNLRVALKRDLIETFLHELAHAMQFYAYGECDHGASWWEMMHQLGQAPKRTHSIAECTRAVRSGQNVEELGL